MVRDGKRRRNKGEQGRSERALENVCSGVGYGKMDYPTQQAIYHCQRGRGERKERQGEGYPVEKVQGRGGGWKKGDK